jgi:hypothetical protein
LDVVPQVIVADATDVTKVNGRWFVGRAELKLCGFVEDIRQLCDYIRAGAA